MAEKLFQQIAGEFAIGQGEPAAYDLDDIVQGGRSEIAIDLALGIPVALVQQGGQGAGPPPGVHIKMKIPHHENGLRWDLQPLGGQQDPVRMGFGAHRVVPGNHHIEIVDAKIGELLQGRYHRGPAVAGDDADGQPALLQEVEEAPDTAVGMGAPCRFKLHGIEHCVGPRLGVRRRGGCR